MLLPIVGAGLIGLLFFMRGKKGTSAPPNALPVPVNHPPVSVPSGADPGGSVVVASPDTPAQVEVSEVAAEATNVRDWQAAVALAVQAGDAAQLEQVAKTMIAEGLATQGATVLALVEAMRAQATVTTNEIRATTGEAPVTTAQLEPLEAEPIVVVDPRVSVAVKLIQYLASTTKGKEDKASVKLAQEALGNLSADGLYGIDTASRVAEFGIVPLVPWYLPSVNTAARVAAFKSTMMSYASSDPARATQWAYVANRTVF